MAKKGTLKTWYHQPKDRHTRAFVKFCRRQGDRVSIVPVGNRDDLVNIHVVVHDEEESAQGRLEL